MIHRIAASNRTVQLALGWSQWRHLVKAAHLQQAAGFLSATHFLEQLQRRLWLRWRRICHHRRGLRWLLLGFLNHIGKQRQRWAFRNWLWKLCGPALVERLALHILKRRIGHLMRAWAAVGAERRRFNALSAAVQQRRRLDLKGRYFRGWVGGWVRFGLKRLFAREEAAGRTMERELDEQYKDVLPKARIAGGDSKEDTFVATLERAVWWRRRRQY